MRNGQLANVFKRQLINTSTVVDKHSCGVSIIKRDSVASRARFSNHRPRKEPRLSAPGIAAIRSVPARVRGKLNRREWRSIAGMAGLIIGLHAVGWGVMITIVAPAQYQVASGQVLGIGLGVT